MRTHKRAVAKATEEKLMRFLRGQNLTATVHAGLQVDVVRTTQFAGVLVLDEGRRLQASAERRIPRFDGSLFSSVLPFSLLKIGVQSKVGRRVRPFKTRLDLGNFAGLIHAASGFDQSPQYFFDSAVFQASSAGTIQLSASAASCQSIQAGGAFITAM